MRKSLPVIIAVTIILASIAYIVIPDSATATSHPLDIGRAPLDNWTVLVYLDADNELEWYGIEDFMEMSEVGSSVGVNIVVEMDRWDGMDYSWYDFLYDDTSYDNWTSAKRFFVTQGMEPTIPNAIMDIGEVNMGDPNTLTNFISWGVKNYPAEHYLVDIWDHGGQWEGVCWDYTSSYDYLTLPEVGDGLYWAAWAHDNMTFDIIGFDACLMAGLEVDAQIADLCDIILGAENLEPDLGWNYMLSLTALSAHPEMTPEQLSSQIIDDFVYSYRNSIPGYDEEDVALSSVRANLVSDMTDKTNALSQLLNDSMQKWINFIEFCRNNAETYYYDYIDLFHFSELVHTTIPNGTARAISGSLMDSINSSVIDEHHFDSSLWPETVRNSHGVSIYFPEDAWYYNLDYETNPELILPATTNWDEFLSNYLGEIDTGNSAPTISSYNPVAPPSITEGQTQRFNITAADPDGNDIAYLWYVDSVIVSNATGSSFTYWTDFASAGTHEVKVIAWDGELNDTQTWILTVNDLILPAPDSAIQILSPFWSKTDSRTITATASDPLSIITNVTLWCSFSPNNLTWSDWNYFGTDQSSPWSWSFVFSDGQGYYRFFSVANDTMNITEQIPATADAICGFDTTRPLANPGSYSEVRTGTALILNGTGSTDNFVIANYTWNFVYNGTTHTIYGPHPTFTFWTEGDYVINLTVKDGAGNWDNDTVAISVTIGDIVQPVDSLILLFFAAFVGIGAAVIIYIATRRKIPPQAMEPQNIQYQENAQDQNSLIKQP